MTLKQALQIFELVSLHGQDAASLKKIYYRLAQKYHPDKGGTFEAFILLQEAHLYLKKSLSKDSTFDDQNQSSSNQNYSDFQAKYNQIKDRFNGLLNVVQNYENIFNAQIKIINRSNDSIRILFASHDTLKNNLRFELNKNLDQVKKNYEKTWWEYFLPTRKLTQEQYIQKTNALIANFNQANQGLDEELVSQMLRLYRGSFQDLINLLSDI